MKHIVAYTSDVHGNEVQYQKLVNYALKSSVDSVIVGGDIAPKGLPAKDFISVQRTFLQERLPKLFSPFNNSSTQAYIMMGNDDCAANYDVFERREEDGLYKIIHGKRLKLTNDFDLVGYSGVPITPFFIKDWEKFDLSGGIPLSLAEEYQARKSVNYVMNGTKSSKVGWVPFRFTLEMEKTDSIQKDLSTKLFQESPGQTAYVMHAPPNQTNLDMMWNGHIGSFAERLFIEQGQPYLTLHGHIHETVAVSGTFKHQIGRTLSFASGNHNVGEDLAVIVFDLYDLRSARRLIL